MKITQKQLYILHQTLLDSLNIHSNIFYFNNEDRVKIAQEILNQQSDEIQEIK